MFYPGSIFRPDDQSICFMPLLEVMTLLKMQPSLHPDWYSADLLLKNNNKLNYAKI